MKLTSEWEGRLRHWTHTLTKDFYVPLEDIQFDAYLTYEHLTPEAALAQTFTPMPVGTAWGNEWQYAWLKADITLPKEAEGNVIVLNLNPGGEATIFVNGEAFGTYRSDWVTVPHHFVQDNILTEGGHSGQTFSILCEVYAGHYIPEGKIGHCAVGPVLPGDYVDPLAGKRRTALGACSFGIWNEDAYQLWMDVMALTDVMGNLSEGSLRAAKIAKALQSFTLVVDFEQAMDARVLDYRKAREVLRTALEAENGTTAPTFYAIGNAHLDVVWLWPYAETNRKTARTFAAQLRLIDKYPGYKFIQSQPLTYVMCREHYPALYEKIKRKAKEGNWIAEGAMWVEPDTNMSSGESLIRQLVYGMRFFKEEFDVDCEILWLPDTFGYSAALPQILKNCGIKYLVTQKIFWSYNEGDQFPYHYFTWRGNDGSEIVSYLPTNYTYTTNPKLLMDVWESRVIKDDLDKFLLPFGYGDGGGGPSRDYIEFAIREKNLEGCPKVELAHPKKFFSDLEAEGGPEHTYVGELYFTAHRGVYTTQASVKWGNRKSELALREAEMWGAIATAYRFAYPYAEAESAWKKVLLNQFHDILPGSSIARVYTEAAILHKEAIESGETLAHNAASILGEEGNAILVFNSLSWERDVIVSLPEEFANGAHDGAGNAWPVYAEGNQVSALIHLPSCGYAPVHPGNTADTLSVCPARAEITANGAVLENGMVKAAFNSQGEITSFVLKETGREFAEGEMNRFLLYKDVPRTFDAWDIDSQYEQQLIEMNSTAEITLESDNPLKSVIRIKKCIGHSFLCQDISLCANSRRIEFYTTVEWKELHRLLKVSFPVDVKADEGINEIQFGYMKRPTHRSRAYDKDRFEVCNHRYTALCDEGHGAAVLNDCKYGISMLNNTMNLTLLRAGGSPEMRTDNGTHQFVYAFTAWEGSFLDSPVTREGYELNVPPLLCRGGGSGESYFQIEGCANVIIDTVKPSEDERGDIIVRLYEAKRADCCCVLRWNLPVEEVFSCNMLESKEGERPLSIDKNNVHLHFKPFEVKTLRLKLRENR